MAQKSFTLADGTPVHVRFVVGNADSAEYEVAAQGKLTRAEVGGSRFCIPYPDGCPLSPDQVQEALNLYFADNHATYASYCEQQGLPVEQPVQVLNERVKWIGVTGNFVPLPDGEK